MTRPTTYELEMLTPDELGILLFTEIERNHYDIQHIQNLITVGCPIDYRNPFGQTPLHFTALRGRYDILEVLVHNGADINARDNGGWTPLHFIVNGRSLDMIKFLVEKGADVNARTNEGLGVVGIAMMRMIESPEIVKFLISKGAA